MVFKIDVDGVIRDIIPTMCEIYNSEFHENISPEDIVDYDVNLNFQRVKEVYGISPREYFFVYHSDKVFEYDSQPFNGVKEAIDALRTLGHKVVIVTWQFDLSNKIHTLRFLNVHGIKYDDICFTRDKWMIKGDYLIDDNPEFITDKRDKSKKIIVDTPYNRNISKKYVRVNSLKEAVNYIFKQEKLKDAA